ncbi:MAG: hypothetical protein ABW133_11955 [Polyangiaceae bacterium]
MEIGRHPRRLGAGALVMALGFVAFPALAEPPSTSDRADAEGLSAAAAVLVEEKDFVHACAKYEAATRLDPHARRFMKLADCFEKAGMPSRAWMSYGDAQDMALARGDKPLAQTAGENVKRLDAKLARIAVVVPPESSIEGLQVRRDGAVVSEAVRGVPVPVDPGSHVILATAPGHRSWSTTISLAAGKTAVSVVIPILEDGRDAGWGLPEQSGMKATCPPGLRPLDDVDLRDPTRLSAPPPPLISALAPERGASERVLPPPRMSEAPVSEDPGKSQRTIAWVMGGVGLASVFGGFAFAVQANDTRADLTQRCPGGMCSSASYVDDQQTARNQAMASNILFWGGATALAGAAVVYFTAPSAPKATETASIRVAPSVAPNGAGLFASGRF